MTLTIVKTIPAETVAMMVEYLNTTAEPLLQPDVSNYARGRMRLWFPYEAPLSDSRMWARGAELPRMWNWLVRNLSDYNFVPEAALASKGGEISEHRDAAYSDFRAFGLNLGVCSFHYRPIYPSFQWSPATECLSGEEQVLEMTGGELFEFNVKNPHWVTDVAPNRWGINTWHVSGKGRAKFEVFKRSL